MKITISKLQFVVSFFAVFAVSLSSSYAADGKGGARKQGASTAQAAHQLATSKKAKAKIDHRQAKRKRLVPGEYEKYGLIVMRAIPTLESQLRGQTPAYGNPILGLARHSGYNHDPAHPETYVGKDGKKHTDWDSAYNRSSTGAGIREGTAYSPATLAVSIGNKGDIWLNLRTGRVGVNADTVGTTKAATCNYLAAKRKIKGKWVKRTICLHKTYAQLHAPVVDEPQNPSLNQPEPEYDYYLRIPRIDPRPFRNLSPAEQENEIACAVLKARIVEATYFHRNRLMAKR